MRDDIAAATFLGYSAIMRGHQGPRQFSHHLYNPDLRATVVGRGATRRSAERDAAAKAIAQHQTSLFAAQQAVERAASRDGREHP